jgi:hypothetical protein
MRSAKSCNLRSHEITVEISLQSDGKLIRHLRCFRTRPNKSHLSSKDVPDLWNFVHPIAAEKATEGRDRGSPCAVQPTKVHSTGGMRAGLSPTLFCRKIGLGPSTTRTMTVRKVRADSKIGENNKIIAVPNVRFPWNPAPVLGR